MKLDTLILLFCNLIGHTNVMADKQGGHVYVYWSLNKLKLSQENKIVCRYTLKHFFRMRL